LGNENCVFYRPCLLALGVFSYVFDQRNQDQFDHYVHDID
jgi:hypothetical protein